MLIELQASEYHGRSDTVELKPYFKESKVDNSSSFMKQGP